MYTIPVNDFPDAVAAVVQGLKKRFSEGNTEFKTTRVSVKKTEADAPAKPAYETVVMMTSGREEYQATMRDYILSVSVFAPDYSKANKLAEVTCGYIKSLPALGKGVLNVSIEATGLHIDNQGPEELRQITARLRIKANNTTLYIGE